jgi:hypothetical protein
MGIIGTVDPGSIDSVGTLWTVVEIAGLMKRYGSSCIVSSAARFVDVTVYPFLVQLDLQGNP